MRLVVFGLTISSSWGNGHATLWRGLCRALHARGHEIVFFERDAPYYRSNRDLWQPHYAKLVFYSKWAEVRTLAAAELARADVGMVTSYCPDGLAATELVLGSRCQLTTFYDLDTPITLDALERGAQPAWIGERGLSGFDLVLSFTGGRALDLLVQKLGAGRVAALYGHVDPEVHRPAPAQDLLRGKLSYLGTYSSDRQAGVEELFLEPARRSRAERFVLGGSLYPESLSLPENVVHLPHVAPPDHASFFCSSQLTLNVTRGTMARLGHCPSGRLFEAAACGAPLLSDWFEGLDAFFEPGEEICVVESSAEVLEALSLSDAERLRLSCRARERTLAEHTAAQRALTLEGLFDQAQSSQRDVPPTRPRARSLEL